MKEKRSFKRFDLISLLAVLGVLLVLTFESFFIFEFYRMDYAKIEPYLPEAVKDWLASAVPERPAPAQTDGEPAEQEAGLTEEDATAVVEETPGPAEGDPAEEPESTNDLVTAETNSISVQEEAVVNADEALSPAEAPESSEEPETIDDEQAVPGEEPESEEDPEPDPVG